MPAMRKSMALSRFVPSLAALQSRLGARSGGRVGIAIVRGRSMAPTLLEGDRLLVRYGAAPRAGRLAVVRFSDGVVAVKRLDHRSADGWWVVRDNSFEGRDSWSGGAIAPDGVLAMVLTRLWPHPGRLPGPPDPVGR